MPPRSPTSPPGAPCCPRTRWRERYELAFALELNRAECELLSGDVDAAETRLSALSGARATLADRPPSPAPRVEIYHTSHRSPRAVEAALGYLRQVGIDWTAHPTETEVADGVRVALASARRPFRSNPSSICRRSRDPDWPATMDVLQSTISPALDSPTRTCTICWSAASPGSASRTETATPRAWPMSAWRRSSGAASATTRRGSGSASSGSIWSSSTASRASRQPST